MTLNDLKPGQSGTVTGVWATGPLRRRLMDMGVVPGTSVSVEKIAPLGDPVEVWIKQYRLSLRKAEAGKIEVEIRP
ncbi:MAG: ferrous iron transport protein A [Syntrophaceae bacterium]|nr:ferrous iron transport protein A [Syntrophaceae bacterium]